MPSTKLQTNEHAGWGLLLVMLGVVELLPVPSGSWLIGTGAILIGLCVQQLCRRTPMSWFTLALGVFALAGGIAEVRGLDAPLLPLLLIVIGARILIGSRITARR